MSKIYTRKTNVALSLLFLGAVLLLSGLFVQTEINIAKEKSFWLDEHYGLVSAVRGDTSVFSLLVKGPPFQGSPAPLDYILLKGLDAAKFAVGYLGLHPFSYFRLVAFCSLLFAGCFLAGGMWTALQPCATRFVSMSYLLILFGLFSLWFNPFTLYYAAEMRPYSLWNSLWAASLGSFLIWPHKRKLSTFLLTLLALTATAAIFQLFALFLAYFSVNLLDRKPKKQLLRECIALFSIPTVISLYYSLQSGTYEYTGDEWGTWPRFLEFWIESKWVLMTGSAAALFCLLKRETRIFSIAGLAVVLLYFMAPLIFFITRSKGFFFAERQYIWFYLGWPVLFFSLSRCIPFWLTSTKKSLHIPVVVVIVLGLLGFYDTQLNSTFQRAKYELGREVAANFPIDPQNRMNSLLKKELPAGFCVPEASERTVRNLILLREWLPVHYQHLAQGNKTIFLTEEDENISILSVEEKECSEGDFYSIPVN